MAVNLLKKRPLTLAAMLLLAGQAQATELLSAGYKYDDHKKVIKFIRVRNGR
ncbi:hypothetical protein OZO43_002887 [Salmonella enterica]|nr:hypothetical protein [Salmonella enterica]